MLTRKHQSTRQFQWDDCIQIGAQLLIQFEYYLYLVHSIRHVTSLKPHNKTRNRKWSTQIPRTQSFHRIVGTLMNEHPK